MDIAQPLHQGMGGWDEVEMAGSPASRCEQQLNELLELFPVLVDVDLSLPQCIDQHCVVDLVQHDVCPQLGVQSVWVKVEGSPQEARLGWGDKSEDWGGLGAQCSCLGKGEVRTKAWVGRSLGLARRGHGVGADASRVLT